MSESSRRSLTGALAFLTGTRLVINTAQRFVYPFLPAISRGLGVSLDAAGYLVSARWAAGLATPAVVAVVGKGERRRRPIAVSLVFFSVGAAITAATTWFVGALAGFVLMGLSKPVFDISAQAYLADRVAYSARARYLAVLELTWAGGLLVGAPAAGWLIDSAGWSAPFWVISGLAAAALVLQSRVLEPDRPRPAGTRTELQWDLPAAALLVAAALFSAASEIVFVAYGAWLETGFSLSLAALGGTAVIVALAELSGEGTTLAITDRIGKRRAVVIGLVFAAAGFGSIALFDDSLVAGMGALLVGVAGFEFTIVSLIPLATEVRPLGRAAYLSWMIVAMSLGRAAGAAVGAPLFGAAGMGANALVAAAANVVAAGLVLTWVREAEAGASDFPADFVLPE
jgi:predicted MFS family arabinose efflux permease